MHSATRLRQHGRGERERRELRRAEVADDRGVDQQVERLGRQRAERGQREAQDLARRRASGARRPLYDPPMVRGSSRWFAARRAGRRPAAATSAPLDGACLSRRGTIERALARPRAR